MKIKTVDIAKCGFVGFYDEDKTAVFDSSKKKYSIGKHKFFDSSRRIVPVFYKRKTTNEA